jgi:hypothetical protein
MIRYNREKIFSITAIILLGVCLGLYVSFVRFLRYTAISENPSVAYKIYKSAGVEFRIFWTASFMALNGKLPDIYNHARFEEVEDSFTGSNEHHVWLYPPSFLLMILPLSLLPYLASLSVWLVITLVGYLLVLRRICPQPPIFFWILLFPGIAFNVLVGHNGCLSGTLLGAGLLSLGSSPIIAGILFGLMFYKPQIAILLPLALLAGRRWKVLGVTAATVSGTAIVSALILGWGPWLDFFHNLLASGELVDIPFFWARMPTVYAAARSAGSGTGPAWLLQGLVMVGVSAGVYWVWSGEATAASRAAVLIIGILLFSHYAFIYDYAILAIPLAWLWQEGQTRGWLALEKPLLLGAWIMPLIGLMLSADYPMWVPVLPTLLALFMLVLRRHYHELGKGRQSTAFAAL